MENTVFISHSHKDNETAQLIRNILIENGIGCWICSKNIEGGELWASEIVKAIEECKVFLFLLSENSTTSTQCYKEIALADGANCKPICLNLDNSSLIGDIKYHFILTQILPINKENLKTDISGVIDKIKRIECGETTNIFGADIPCFDFEFTLDLKNSCRELTGPQKLSVSKILALNNDEFNVTVKLKDENLAALYEQHKHIEKQLEDNKEVSDQDINLLTTVTKVCMQRKRKNFRKTIAAKLFLYDVSTHALCGLRSVNDIFEILKLILEFDPQYIPENFVSEYDRLEFLYPNKNLYFAANIHKDVITKRRKEMGYFCEIGLLPVVDFGTENLKQILPNFYNFMASEIIAGNYTIQDPKTRKLLNYQFGYK